MTYCFLTISSNVEVELLSTLNSLKFLNFECNTYLLLKTNRLLFHKS